MARPGWQPKMIRNQGRHDVSSPKRRRFRHLFRVVGDVKVRVDKENVFGLEVRVGQFVVVQEPDGVGQLVANMANLFQRVRLVVVVLLLNKFN